MNTENTDFNEDGKLEYESPLLTKLKQSPIVFKEPDGYFEQFNRELMDKIQSGEYEKPQVKSLVAEEKNDKKGGAVRKMFQPWYAIAASVVIALSIIGFNYFNKKSDIKPITETELAEVILTENISSIDEELLMDVLDEKLIEEQNMIEEDEDISNEMIIDYLLENDFDIYMINEL